MRRAGMTVVAVLSATTLALAGAGQKTTRVSAYKRC